MRLFSLEGKLAALLTAAALLGIVFAMLLANWWQSPGLAATQALIVTWGA